MNERKVPYDPAVAAALGEAEPKADESDRKRPRYPSEANRKKATYDLPVPVIDALRDIGAEACQGTPCPSKVAAAFLAWAVDAYRDGRVTLEFEHDGPSWRLVATEAEK